MFNEKNFEFNLSNIDDVMYEIETQIKSWINAPTPSGLIHEFSISIENMRNIQLCLLFFIMNKRKEGVVTVSFYTVDSLDNSYTNTLLI